MNWEGGDELLIFSIKFALGQCRYRPPARFNIDDPDAAGKYHGAVARAVCEHLKMSWEFRKRPARQ